MICYPYDGQKDRSHNSYKKLWTKKWKWKEMDPNRLIHINFVNKKVNLASHRERIEASQANEVKYLSMTPYAKLG